MWWLERMRQALRESARFRELEGAAIGDLRVRARENAAIAAELLERGVETSRITVRMRGC